MLPYFKPREIPFGGNTSSEEFNEMNKEIALELTQLFQEITNNDIAINEMRERLMVENNHLNNQIDNLKKEISFLENQIDQSEDLKKTFQTFYDSKKISFGENLSGYGEPIDDRKRLNINPNYNAVTLPIRAKQSKTFLRNIHDENVFVPDDIEVQSYGPTYPDAQIKENSGRNALDQDLSTQWRKEFHYEDYEEAPETVETTFHIKMPSSIMSNMNSNTVYINPYPTGTVDIKDVRYKTIKSDEFIPLDKQTTYYDPQNDHKFRTITNSQNTILCFQDVEIVELEIVLEQHHFVNDDDGGKFVLGLNNISIIENRYYDEGKILVNFNVENHKNGELKEVEEITDIRLRFQNLNYQVAQTYGIIDDIKIYGVENDDGSLNEEVELQERIPDYLRKDFWIEISLKNVPQISTSVLEGIEIEYKLR